MRILIFHGYLLRGTGSNVYNASLARALAGLGHEVHLLCQDRLAHELAWVDDEPGPGSSSTQGSASVRRSWQTRWTSCPKPASARASEAL